jgi:Cu-processing system permease protein
MSSLKILKYQLHDALRSRWVIAYTLFFLVVTDALFRFGGTGERVVISLMNVVLLVIPLVSVMLGTMFLYSAREFVELMLTQPLKRRSLFWGLFWGLALPLSGAFLVGTGLPFLLHSPAEFGHTVSLLVTGTLLTFVFTALAFLIALRTEDRVRGMGLALVSWLFFAVIFNGLVLMVIQMFGSYQVEYAVIGMSLLNPVDMARIALLLEFDISALMGYTGALFSKFFGSSLGVGIALAAIAAWLTVPLALGARRFGTRDF